MAKIYYGEGVDCEVGAAIAYRSRTAQRDAEIAVVKGFDSGEIDEFAIREFIVFVGIAPAPSAMSLINEKTKHVIVIKYFPGELIDPGYQVGQAQRSFGNDRSNAELAWLYFCPKDKMPQSIRLIGDAATGKLEYGSTTQRFNEALRIFDTKPKSAMWDDLLGEEKGLESIVSVGAACLKYRDKVLCKE